MTSLKRILVTGGAGFVGATLAIRLREAYPEATVVAFDSLYRRGSELNVCRLRESGVEFQKGDVRERAWDVEPCDLVVDAAAEPSVLAGRGGEGVRYVLDTNLGGTQNALELARQWSAAFVFLSTSRVYPLDALRAIRLSESASRLEIAAHQDLPGISRDGIREDFPLQGARTLYGTTKYASEALVTEYAAAFGLRAVTNRCGVLAGPWQMGRVDQGVVALWIAAHIYRLPLKYIGYSGKQVRDALHIHDLADLLLLQLERQDAWSGEVYNVGGGRDVSFSLRELTELTRDATNVSIEIGEETETRDGDVPLFITDSTRVRNDYQWAPARDMRNVVSDTSDWIHGHFEDLRPVFT